MDLAEAEDVLPVWGHVLVFAAIIMKILLQRVEATALGAVVMRDEDLTDINMQLAGLSIIPAPHGLMAPSLDLRLSSMLTKLP